VIVDEAIAAQRRRGRSVAGAGTGRDLGQVMKASKGQADGKLVNEIVDKRVAAAG
jgi:Asp-tRNA(Asn)/Glu-tRNA(Gln) amidotransferase B subunit